MSFWMGQGRGLVFLPASCYGYADRYVTLHVSEQRAGAAGVEQALEFDSPQRLSILVFEAGDSRKMPYRAPYGQHGVALRSIYTQAGKRPRKAESR